MVDAVGFDDRADAVVEEQAAGAGEPSDFGGQGVAGERPAGDDGDAVLGNSDRFFAPQFDQRLGGDGAGDFLGEDDAVHGERVSARHSRDGGRAQEQRIEPPQFFFQEPGRGAFLVRLERVAADQFGQAVGLMRRRLTGRAHLVEDHRETLASAPGKPLPIRRGRRR